jgi:hypothetical protein
MTTNKKPTDAEILAAMRRYGWLDRNGNGYGGRRCVERCSRYGVACTDRTAGCVLGPDHGGEHLCAVCDEKGETT